MKTHQILLLLVIAILAKRAYGQPNLNPVQISKGEEKQTVLYKHSIGASLLMTSDFLPDPADYFLITYGYQPTRKDRFFAEINTGNYSETSLDYGLNSECTNSRS